MLTVCLLLTELTPCCKEILGLENYISMEKLEKYLHIKLWFDTRKLCTSPHKEKSNSDIFAITCCHANSETQKCYQNTQLPTSPKLRNKT